MLKFAIAADHGGYELKQAIKAALADELQDAGFEWLDLGAHSTDSVNYAEYGTEMGRVISSGKAARGIIICGSGIGISIAANRFRKVRAALVTDATMARLCREHNDANVLALGARIIGTEVALDCVRAFMKTEFSGGRHAARVETLGLNGEEA